MDRNPPIPRARRGGPLAARVGVLLATGVALGLMVNLVHPRAVRLTSFAAPSSCALPAAHAAGTMPPAVEILTLAQVASLCGDPRALVADARSAERFAEGHVTGAIHLSCASSWGTASAALDRLAGKDTLVVYGDGTDDAVPVAEEMRRRGERPGLRVAVLAGGFPAWSQAGLACSSGPCADCGVHR